MEPWTDRNPLEASIKHSCCSDRHSDNQFLLNILVWVWFSDDSSFFFFSIYCWRRDQRGKMRTELWLLLAESANHISQAPSVRREVLSHHTLNIHINWSWLNWFQEFTVSRRVISSEIHLYTGCHKNKVATYPVDSFPQRTWRGVDGCRTGCRTNLSFRKYWLFLCFLIELWWNNRSSRYRGKLGCSECNDETC